MIRKIHNKLLVDLSCSKLFFALLYERNNDECNKNVDKEERKNHKVNYIEK
jgi:hypothetical protein